MTEHIVEQLLPFMRRHEAVALAEGFTADIAARLDRIERDLTEALELLQQLAREVGAPVVD